MNWPKISLSYATGGYHPVATSFNEKALEEDYEKLKLENLNYKQRCKQLEQLCRDMFENCLVCKQNECAVAYWDEDGTHEQVSDYEACTIGRRMEQLGLLEGEDNAV